MDNSKKDNTDNLEVSYQPEVKKVKSGKGLAIFALIFSVLSLAAIAGLVAGGYYLYENNINKNSAAIRESDITSSQAMAVEQGKLQLLENNLTQVNQALASDHQSIQQLSDSFNIIIKDRYQWLLNEVEFSLGIVSIQLINTGNIEAALRSLSYVRDRLNSFDYPQLQPLKLSIAKDIENLKSANSVNISGTLIKIDVLNSKVDNLPLLLDATLNKEINTNKTLRSSIDVTWYEKMWNDFIDVLKSGIQVRELKTANPLLISPDQAFFIKENIKLRFVSARVALLQKQQDTFTQEIHQIRVMVKEYFDNKSQDVVDFINALDTLITLNILPPNIELINDSLTLVKTLQTDQITVPDLNPTNTNNTTNKEVSPSTGNEETSTTGTTNNSPAASANGNVNSVGSAPTASPSVEPAKKVTSPAPTVNQPKVKEDSPNKASSQKTNSGVTSQNNKTAVSKVPQQPVVSKPANKPPQPKADTSKNSNTPASSLPEKSTTINPGQE